MTTIALIDDHNLMRTALKELINRFDHFEVVLEAANGKEFIDKLAQSTHPEIVLLDINMPIMDGYATANFLTKNYPHIKVLALSVNDDDESILKMVQAGAVGYLLKDTETLDLQTALEEVLEHGYYHTDLVTNTLIKTIKPNTQKNMRALVRFHSREEEFLKNCCTEMTYKEIAAQMNVAPRTVDGYRDALFEKLSVKSRVGLVLFAIKGGYFDVY